MIEIFSIDLIIDQWLQVLSIVTDLHSILDIYHIYDKVKTWAIDQLAIMKLLDNLHHHLQYLIQSGIFLNLVSAKLK